MDSQQFRLPTKPNLIASTATSQQVETQIAQSAPSLNNRYKGYAAIGNDQNLFTDFRPKCSTNIPAGQQYATRQWLQHNADTLIRISRERQATAVGATFKSASTVPPPVAFVKCQTDKCGYYEGSSGNPQLIPTGVERADVAPELFGTFNAAYRQTPALTGRQTTRKYEGGRNTPRGSTF